MTTLVRQCPDLLEALKGLPPEVKAGLRAKRHPDGRWFVLHSRSLAADRAARELADRFGEGRWQGTGWTIRRPQLRLPGF